MKRTTKIIVGIVCLVLAVAAVFVATPLIAQLTANKAEVVVMAQDVVKGKTLTEDDLTVVEISMNNMREDIARKDDLSAVIGQYALVDLKKGDFITGEKVGATTNASDQAIAALPKGKEAYSVKFTGLETSVSSKIKDGDIVCCYIYSQEEGKTTIDKKLQYLKVLTATDSSGVDTKDEDPSGKKVSQTVTLLVAPEQVKALSTYNYSGRYKISFSVIFRGSNTEADEYVRKQDAILARMDAE